MRPIQYNTISSIVQYCSLKKQKQRKRSQWEWDVQHSVHYVVCSTVVVYRTVHIWTEYKGKELSETYLYNILYTMLIKDNYIKS